jgi:AcrR family transcriptional regulator
MASGNATRKRLPPAERRELIARAAERAFGREGYDGASLEAIAADAGVTKPVLYRHFASKEELYLALLERHREDLPRFLEGLPLEAPIDELMRAVLEGWFAYAEEHGARWRMIFRDSGGGPKVVATRESIYGEARAVLVGFLRAHPAFDVPEAQQLAAAEAVRGALSTLVLFGQDPDGPPREQLVEAGVRVVLGFTRRERP